MPTTAQAAPSPDEPTELQAMALKAVASASSEYSGERLRRRAALDLRVAHGKRLSGGLLEYIAAVDWAITHGPKPFTRADKERAVTELAGRLVAHTSNADTGARNPDVPHAEVLSRFRQAARTKAALIRVAMVRTAD